MQITGAAVSLTVEDVTASAAFLQQHFGFAEQMAADGFASLGRPDSGMNVVYLRRGLDVLPEGFRDQHAAGLILAFTVADVAAEEARLRAAACGDHHAAARRAVGRAAVPGHRPERGGHPTGRVGPAVGARRQEPDVRDDTPADGRATGAGSPWSPIQ